MTFMKGWWGIPRARLGYLRVVVALSAIWHLERNLGVHASVAKSPPAMFRGIGVTQFMDGPIAPETFMGLTYLAIVLSAVVMLGWRTRVFAPLWAGLLLFVLTYRTSWVQIYHSDNLLALSAVALALAPAAGSTVSLDARAGRNQDREDWEFAWPIVMIAGVITITYMIAGAAKIANSEGVSWMLGTNLRDQIAYNALNKELLGGRYDEAARWAYAHPLLLKPGSVMALLLEVAAPLVLLHRGVGKLWAVGVFGMHWGIYALMSIAFPYPLYGWAFAAFFDLEKVGDRLVRAGRWLRARWMPTRPPAG